MAMVAVAREDAHAPFGALGDPAGGDRRDRAVGKADARVGDVLVRAGDGGADRVHALDRAVDQRQHQVEIVDHQIEDDRYVGAARLERRDARRLDIQRRAESAGQRAVRGGEAFQMADLQHEPARGGERGEIVGLGERAAIGFSTSTCLPARNAAAARA